MITRWLIRRRDAAADTWLREAHKNLERGAMSAAERAARRRLIARDRMLAIWARVTR